MDSDELIAKYPRLFHMAEDGAWDNIRQNGLLSTRALVDRYQPDQDTRDTILGQIRLETVELTSPGLPPAQVRDQLPLRGLPKKLTPGTTQQQFLDALNERVFFWLDEKRLDGLLTAKPYRASPHIVLTVTTQSLVRAYGDRVRLARMNTGAVIHANHPARGPDVFESIDHYQKRRVLREGAAPTSTPPVELTVLNAVPNIVDHVETVYRWESGRREDQALYVSSR